MHSILFAFVCCVSLAAQAADSDFRPATASSAKSLSGFRDNPAGAGGLKRHEVVTSVRDVTVYRLYDSRAPSNPDVAGRTGKYWTDVATRTESSARDQLAVCKGWNNMHRVVRCTLPKGSTIVKGPGQDAKCSGLSKSGSTAWHRGGPQQLFIPSFSMLTNCKDSDTGW